MPRRALSLGLIALLIGLLAASTAQPASKAAASRGALLGIFDEGQTLYGNVDYAFPVLADLNVQIIRSHLYWGGRFGVAKSRPARPADPDDPAYDWSLYERQVDYASQHGIKVVFSIFGSPGWANGGRTRIYAPRRMSDLRAFATAAARKFPQVKHWLAWNEPNNPSFLRPQYVRKNVGGSRQWVMQSAITYAQICNAVYAGVKAAGNRQLVGCGVTGPQGNDRPTGARPAPTPISFLRATKAAGLKRLDAWAHHPYASSPAQTPFTRPRNGAVGLGNIDVLIREITRGWGRKPLWITEYGYQTKPQDRFFGVTYAKQALYLRQSWQIVRRNPRITMMIWFIFQDDTNVRLGWQSGLLTYRGAKKPSYNVFKGLPR